MTMRIAPESSATTNGERGFDGFVARLGDRDRLNVTRHLTACETDGQAGHAVLWRRVVGILGDLSPHAAKMSGMRAIQFFAADGKHRKQMFALEDARDGVLLVYAPDVLRGALAAKTIALNGDDDAAARHYDICGKPGERLLIESLTAAGTTFAPDFYRHMLGWNRTAIRFTLPIAATPAQIEAMQQLCSLAVHRS